jgi:hypothetical protein
LPPFLSSCFCRYKSRGCSVALIAGQASLDTFFSIVSPSVSLVLQCSPLFALAADTYRAAAGQQVRLQLPVLSLFLTASSTRFRPLQPVLTYPYSRLSRYS